MNVTTPRTSTTAGRNVTNSRYANKSRDQQGRRNSIASLLLFVRYVPGMSTVAGVPSVLTTLLLLTFLLLLLVHDAPGISAVAGVPSIAITPAAVSVPAAVACPHC
jgi:hypothetical protein